MKYLNLFIFLFSAQVLFSQQVTLKKGMVTDNLIVADSTHKETFSIYLPTYYSKDKSWPVIFVFDSKGRGKVVTQLFKQTAEEQGYLVASSNVILEGKKLVANAEVGNRLIETVSSYFSVDNNAIYMAGLDEGALATMALSAVKKNVKGVLAIGDFWINSDVLKPGSGYPLVGMINYEDPDYYRLTNISNFISKIGYPTRIYKFDEQEYPSADLIYSGVSEFTLQRLKSDTSAHEKIDIDRLFQHDIQIATNMRRQLKLFKSYEFLDLLDDKYVSDEKHEQIKELQKQLRKNKVFKEQRRKYNAISTIESFKKTQYSYFLSEDLEDINFENLGYWNQQIKELKESQGSENLALKEMSFRMQGYLKNIAFQTFEELKKKKAKIDLLIYTAVLKTIFDKQNPEGYFDIISLAAKDGDYSTAMLYLEDLLMTGYKNMDALYDIPGTLDLKLSPEYNQLIKKYLGASKFYNLKLN